MYKSTNNSSVNITSKLTSQINQNNPEKNQDVQSCKTIIDGANINASQDDQDTSQKNRKMSEAYSNTSQTHGNGTFYMGAGGHCSCKAEIDQLRNAISDSRSELSNLQAGFESLVLYIGFDMEQFLEFYRRKQRLKKEGQPGANYYNPKGIAHRMTGWSDLKNELKELKEEMDSRLLNFERNLACDSQPKPSYQDTPINDFTKKVETPNRMKEEYN